MNLKKLSLGIGVLAGCLGILGNFGSARTQLVELWPTIQAVLPVLALGGALGGATLIVGTVRRWHVDRRPQPPSERFRALTEEIRLIADSYSMDVDSPSVWLDLVTLSERTKSELAALGVQLPETADGCVELLILADQAQLAEAREQFPME